MMLLALTSVILPIILISLNLILFKKEATKRNSIPPFECGFDPKSSGRTPFSIRFFLIAIIFLIFDIEITLILPIPMIFYISSKIFLITLFLTFVVILLAGLYHEWNKGALNWM